MSQTITLNIPSSLQDITLGQYQKYIKSVEHLTNKEEPTQEEVEFSNLKMLECFCGITMKEAYKLPMTEFTSVIRHVNELFAVEHKLHNKFNMIDPDGNNVTFGFIPKLEDMSMGEFIDLEKYIGDWQQMHKAMAILYRPTKHQKNDFYLIEDYEGSDRYAEVPVFGNLTSLYRDTLTKLHPSMYKILWNNVPYRKKINVNDCEFHPLPTEHLSYLEKVFQFKPSDELRTHVDKITKEFLS